MYLHSTKMGLLEIPELQYPISMSCTIEKNMRTVYEKKNDRKKKTSIVQLALPRAISVLVAEHCRKGNVHVLTLPLRTMVSR